MRHELIAYLQHRRLRRSNTYSDETRPPVASSSLSLFLRGLVSHERNQNVSKSPWSSGSSFVDLRMPPSIITGSRHIDILPESCLLTVRIHHWNLRPPAIGRPTISPSPLLFFSIPFLDFSWILT
ncbi:hypothetical protein GQ457_12G015220 [Hibiscus cannabinus]